MRVLLVANTLPPEDISGVGEQVMQLAAGLRKAGHEVRLLGRGPSGAMGPKVLFPLTAVPAFWRVLYEFRPHIVQVHESDGAFVALAARVSQAMVDPPPKIVALLQVSYIEELKAVRVVRDNGRVIGRPGFRELRFKWLKAPLQVLLGCLTAWLSDQVLAPSRRTANEIESDYLISSVAVLPNVTGGREIGPPANSDPGESGYLLFVGRLRIRKAVEVLLHALDQILLEIPGTKLLVAGDGEHRSRLQAAAAQLGLAGRIEFLGRCNAGQVQELMSSASALVVSSIYEGMPLVILEAMHQRLPVVASAVSGIPEVVLDGERGWLVPAEDSTALAAALREVLANPAEANRRASLAFQWVAQEANPESAALGWLKLVKGGRNDG